MLNISPNRVKGLKHVLARWFLGMPRRTAKGRHEMAEPPTAPGSECVNDGPDTTTSSASRDDESFPFPRNLRHHHGKSDSDPPPSWWRKFSL
jgi:hypothetical protein